MILKFSLISLFLITTASAQKQMLCYWVSWTPSSVKPSPSLCTTVVFSFVDVSSAGVLTAPSNIADFAALKSQNPGVKFTFAIGGASYASSQAFQAIAASSIISTTFANNILRLLQTYNLDGVDVDWEYPDNQAANFVLLLQILNNNLRQRGYLVTIAVGVDNNLAPNRYDVPNIAKYVDYINLMTYDYHGSWEYNTGLNAPLYGTGTIYTVSQSVSYWTALIGANVGKLLLGLPLYGPTWSLTSSNTGIGAPGMPGSVLTYREICLNIRNNGWTRVFDSFQMTPYAYGSGRWVGYDDAQSIANKIAYLNSNGLGGAFFWEVSQDDYSGACGNGAFPILTYTRNLLNNGASTTKASTTQAPTTHAPTTQALTTTTTKSGGTFMCPAPNGLFKNPSSCRSYYNCANSIAYLTNCPAGLYYNSVYQVCDWMVTPCV